MATENKLLPTLTFDTTWLDPNRFPDYLADETQIRKDLQYHHDLTKDYLNESLIPALEAELGDKASRIDLEEVARGQLPDGSVTKAKLNVELTEELDSKVSQSSLNESLNETLARVAEQVTASTLQVGDTLRTYRGDLGENWLRCTGDMFDPDAYPELAAITPAPEELVAAKLAKVYTLPATPGSYAYAEADGYQVFVTATSDGVMVYYSTDTFATHKTVQLSTASARSACVRYVNGYWIAAWSNSGGTIQAAACNGKPAGEWTTGATTADNGYSSIFDIWFAGESYYLACAAARGTADPSDRYPIILSATLPSFSAATSTDLNAPVSLYRGWVRTADRFMFIGCNSSTALQIVFGAPSTPTSGTSSVAPSFASTTQSGSQSAGSFTYVNEMYLFKSGKILYYSSDFDKGWKSVTFDTDLGDGRIGYARGKYIIVAGSKSVLIGDTLEDVATWRLLEYSSSTVAEQTYGTEPVLHRDSISFVCGAKLVKIPLYALPISDCAPLREYIKVKEVTE